MHQWFLWLAIVVAGLLARPALAQAPRPNVILLFIDDLGYADLGCYGSKEVRTPNLDTIALNGIRFTDGYVSSPVCSPSRAGLLTGRYQQKFGHEFNPTDAGSQDPTFGLPLSESTI